MLATRAEVDVRICRNETPLNVAAAGFREAHEQLARSANNNTAYVNMYQRMLNILSQAPTPTGHYIGRESRCSPNDSFTFLRTFSESADAIPELPKASPTTAAAWNFC